MIDPAAQPAEASAGRTAEAQSAGADAREQAEAPPTAAEPEVGSRQHPLAPGERAERRAARALRRAERARRRYERAEVRRFTRRSRRRRIVGITVGGVFAALVGAVALAVFSPLFALKTITIEGTQRIDQAALHDALEPHLGTPLAMLDHSALRDDLSAFPLIRSFVTETLPPDTLVVRIVEREPIAAIATADGFQLVDPAGVGVLSSEAPVEGMPVVDLRGQSTDSVAFRSVVEVLLAAPPELRGRIVEVVAASKDDVTLVLDGIGQTVVWGSAEESALKARVLARLIATVEPGRAGEFDVSAPTIAIFRPA